MTEWRTRRETSSHTNKRPKRNYYLPTTTACLSTHFPRIPCSSTRHNFSVTSIIMFWLVILAFYSPNYVANGLPLTDRSPYEVKDADVDSLLTFRAGEQIAPNRWHWHLQQNSNELIQEIGGDDDGDDDDDDNENIQEITRLDKPNINARMLLAFNPRRKKGLSFLTKYYSEAFLNNTPSSGGGGGSGAITNASPQHDTSNHFFGVSNSGNTHSSREQRFPSSVRRKLSFYPSMTSHSTFIGPWSRVSSSSSSIGHSGSGRSPTMRLRWGK